MSGQIASPPLSSVRLRIPACMGAIAYVQHATHWFVEQAEMAERQSFAINLAIEELILTLLRHAFDGGSEQGDLEISIELRHTFAAGSGMPRSALRSEHGAELPAGRGR